MAYRLLALVVTGLLLLSAGFARAADYHVVGRVVNAVPALAPYGVTPGAQVDVYWTVDLSTPASSVSGPPDNKSDYQGALDWVLIQIGTWQAVRVAPPMGQIDQGIVAVADGSGGVLDLLHVATPGTDNDLVLHGPAQGGVLILSLDFFALNGGASSNQSLDQDPSLYPNGGGSAQGVGGYVTFTFDDGGGGGSGGGSADPLAQCDSAHLGAASRMCQTQFRCHSGYAKAPSKDPGAERRDACIALAGEAFTEAYTDASASAVLEGLACSTTQPASDLRMAIDARIGEVIDGVNAITPAHAPLVASWLGAAGSACGGALKAEATNAARPDASRLAQARQKAQDKLTAVASKAAAKAEGGGVVFTPPPDVPAFIDSIDDFIDETAADLGSD